ncbi:hypothetical protein ACWGST_00045 [Agromyces sp. NPDC055520]
MTDAEQNAHAEAKAAHSAAIHASWLAWKADSDAATAALKAAEAAFQYPDPELQKAFDEYRVASGATLRAHRERCNAADEDLAAAMKAAT